MQDFIVFMKQYTSSDCYLIMMVFIIAFAFFVGKISSRIMMSQFKQKRYKNVGDFFEEDKKRMSLRWKEAFSKKEKAVMYLTLTALIIPNLIYAVLVPDRDGIDIAILAFTGVISVMEWRDNSKESKTMIETYRKEHLDLLNDMDQIADMEIQDEVLDELIRKNVIDEEKAREIRKDPK